VAQNFATTPEEVYDVLTGDSEFMSYVGEYTFTIGNAKFPSVTVSTPGADLPSLKSQSGLEVIIHDAADISRTDYLTSDSDLNVTWKVFFIVWEPATGLTMTNAVKRAMAIFGGSRSIETVAVADGLQAKVQTLLQIPSTAPILTVSNNYIDITEQPENQSVEVGDSVTFEVVAVTYDGGTLSYQWQRSTGSGFSNISGATNATRTFTVNNLSEDDDQYRCVVSSSGTAPSVTSNAATLTVEDGGGGGGDDGLITITLQPQNTEVVVGDEATFEVAAETSDGGNLGYQWQRSTGGGFSNISGANSDTYVFTVDNISEDDDQYRCVVSSDATAPDVNSNAAVLTVTEDGGGDDGLITITLQPENAEVIVGDAATFIIAAETSDGGNLSYQWQIDTGSGFGNISGATSDTYTFTVINVSENDNKYRCIVSSDATAPSVNSNAAVLTVTEDGGGGGEGLITITLQPESIEAIVDDEIVFEVAAETSDGGNLSYQWQRSTGGDFNNISGATSDTYTFTVTSISEDGDEYRCVVSSDATAPSVNSDVAVLTVTE